MKRNSLLVALLVWVAVGGWAVAGEPKTDPAARYGKPEHPFPATGYWKITLAKPRPLKLFVVRIDLTDPRVSLGVTPPPAEKPDGKEVRLMTTTAFARQAGCQIAINTSPWAPVAAAGTPADIRGLAASKGKVYSPAHKSYPVVNITKDKRVTIGPPDAVGTPYDACSGFNYMVRGGTLHGCEGKRHPRTALGVTKDGRTLILMVTDGRQKGRSEGVSIPELGRFMMQFGAWEAINLDGGGSSTLVFQKEKGKPVIENIPVGLGLPFTERPVAQHLGVWIAEKGKQAGK